MISVSATVNWNDAQIRAAFKRGTKRGLASAAVVVLTATRQKLSRIGHLPKSKSKRFRIAFDDSGDSDSRGTRSKVRRFYRDIRAGERILRSAGSLVGGTFLSSLSRANQRRVKLARKVRDAGGLVDPPGGSPRLRSGDLRRSIIMEPGEDSVKVGSDMAFKVGYAAAQEFGHKNLPARPFLRPSFAESESVALDSFAKALAEEFK